MHPRSRSSRHYPAGHRSPARSSSVARMWNRNHHLPVINQSCLAPRRTRSPLWRVQDASVGSPRSRSLVGEVGVPG